MSGDGRSHGGTWTRSARPVCGYPRWRRGRRLSGTCSWSGPHVENELRAHLAERGVETSIHYPIPPHLQDAYRSLGIARGSLPISESIHDEVLSLPMGPHLTEVQVDQVIEAVRSFPA